MLMLETKFTNILKGRKGSTPTSLRSICAYFPMNGHEEYFSILKIYLYLIPHFSTGSVGDRVRNLRLKIVQYYVIQYSYLKKWISNSLVLFCFLSFSFLFFLSLFRDCRVVRVLLRSLFFEKLIFRHRLDCFSFPLFSIGDQLWWIYCNFLFTLPFLLKIPFVLLFVFFRAQ